MAALGPDWLINHGLFSINHARWQELAAGPRGECAVDRIGIGVGGVPGKKALLVSPQTLSPTPSLLPKGFPSSREAVPAGKTGNLISLLDLI